MNGTSRTAKAPATPVAVLAFSGEKKKRVARPTSNIPSPVWLTRRTAKSLRKSRSRRSSRSSRITCTRVSVVDGACDGHHAYGGTDDTDFTTRLRTIDELRTALTSDQLVVHYQPKIDLLTGEVHDVEALVRWDHPTRGLLYPDAFLDLVEEAGLMRAMTRVVLQIALDQARCGTPKVDA